MVEASAVMAAYYRVLGMLFCIRFFFFGGDCLIFVDPAPGPLLVLIGTEAAHLIIESVLFDLTLITWPRFTSSH